jgi:hypothetical protein
MRWLQGLQGARRSQGCSTFRDAGILLESCPPWLLRSGQGEGADLRRHTSPTMRCVLHPWCPGRADIGSSAQRAALEPRSGGLFNGHPPGHLPAHAVRREVGRDDPMSQRRARPLVGILPPFLGPDTVFFAQANWRISCDVLTSATSGCKYIVLLTMQDWDACHYYGAISSIERTLA